MGGLVPVKLYGPFTRRPSPKYFTGQIKINGTEKFYNTMHKLLWQWENMCWRPLLLCEELKWNFNYCNFYRLFHSQALLQSHGHLWKAEMGLFHSDGRTRWQRCGRVAPRGAAALSRGCGCGERWRRLSVLLEPGNDACARASSWVRTQADLGAGSPDVAELLLGRHFPRSVIYSTQNGRTISPPARTR